jgi:hypothetical protein
MRHGSLDGTTIVTDAGCPIVQPVIAWRGRNGGQSESISNMKQVCSGIGCMTGQGGLMVQAGDGAVTVMYSANDDPPQPTCTASGAGVPSQMGWGTVTTYDKGINWTTDPLIFQTSSYVWCMGDTTHQVFTGLRDFGFTRAGNGHLYAAVHSDPNEIRVFESDNRGAAWREFCPANIGLQPDGGPGTPPSERQTSPWMQAGFVCPISDLNAAATDGGLATNGFTNTGMLWPTLAADGDMQTGAGVTTIAQQKSRVVLTWSQALALTDAGASPPFTQVIQGNSDPASGGFATDRFQQILPLSLAPQLYNPNSNPPPSAPNLLGQWS